jgi:hypothetical protein
MLEFYEPILNLSDSLHHNTMGVILSLKDPVNGSILQSVVEKLRVRFPYFYVKAAYRGNDLVTVPNSLPMTVRHTWDPVSFNTESSNYHLAAWKYKEYRLAFEISHSLTDGSGVLPYVQSVLYLYLSKVTGRSFDPAGFRLPGQPIPESETGNPFKGLNIDGAAAPLYQKKPISDFFRLAGGRSFGPLDPWIDELYIMTSLSKITDVLCLITCIGHSFFLAFIQPFSSPDYFRCFLNELVSTGIQYEMLRSEPLRLCGIG